MNPARLEVIQTMEPHIGGLVNELLKPIQESWQPSDFLPTLSSETWAEDIKKFRDAAAALSDEILVALVGDMITEEALPSYQTWINRLEGITDVTGDSDNAWARWGRGWTAEENRHGDLLNRYLYLTGRVDMRAVELTIQYLIRNGFNPQTERDPYQGFIYTSFQERATKISHRNVAILATKSGEARLQNVCGLIAGDEARHEKAYTLFVQKIFELDPSEAVIAFAKMMKKKITMPASLMEDGSTPHLFDAFSTVAQRIGVYTAQDYAAITEHLVTSWNVAQIPGLSGEAAEAQEYVCGLPARYAKLASRRQPAQTKVKFSWIFNREA